MKPVGELQDSLYRAAKADRKKVFYSLKDKICRTDVLYEAWRRVRENEGAAGVDKETIQDIENNGVDQFLSEIQRELLTGTYWVESVRRVYIPKPDGRQRPLGIPTVRDRVVQQAVRLIIEPIFEADFQPFSYGYRPNKSAKQATVEVYRLLNYNLTGVVDVDIQGFFDHVNHAKLLSFVRGRIADGFVIGLIRKWLKAGAVYLDNSIHYPEEGTPQGGVISPLLANIYLNRFDTRWRERGMDDKHGYDSHVVRYADDSAPRMNCARDGGRPSGAALPGEAPNHRKLLRSKAGVVSVAGKGRPTAGQVRVRETNESEPTEDASKA